MELDITNVKLHLKIYTELDFEDIKFYLKLDFDEISLKNKDNLLNSFKIEVFCYIVWKLRSNVHFPLIFCNNKQFQSVLTKIFFK